MKFEAKKSIEKIIIRKADKKDIDSILLLYIEYNGYLERLTSKKNKLFNEKKKDINKEIKKSIKYNLNEKDTTIFVAEEEGKIVGSVSGWITINKNDLYKDSVKLGHLQYLIISEEYRKRGIANKLKQELLNYFKKMKVQFVRIEVSSKNPAIKLYEKWGFEPEAIKMIKKLR